MIFNPDITKPAIEVIFVYKFNRANHLLDEKVDLQKAYYCDHRKSKKGFSSYDISFKIYK